MANEKPISKGYLLTQLKNYETEIINKKYIEKEDGKGLSSNDYTTEEKNKLAGLENYNDTALSNRVKSVEDEVPNLATKTYVGEQVANAEHLKREIVNVLPSDTKASDNIIYMLKVESTTGNDKYQEYMKIDGTVQMVGDTSVDLTDYAKSTDIPTTVAQLTDSASYAKKTEIPTTLPANGGNADTVNNHTVETDVPTDAKFTDTVYDDTEVKGSIDELRDNLGQLEHSDVAGGKSLFNLSKVPTMSKNGITFVNNRDGTYTLNGTATQQTDFELNKNVKLEYGKNYRIVGCPTNGSLETYKIMTQDYPSWGNTQIDHGNGSLLTVNEGQVKYIWIRVMSGATLNNVVFKPMIVDADKYPNVNYYDFEPYIPSVKMLAEEVSAQNDSLDVIGKCKNLLNPTLQTTTLNGVTCTNNGDGTFTFNGTVDSGKYPEFPLGMITLDKGKYLFPNQNSSIYLRCGTSERNHDIVNDQLLINNFINIENKNDFYITLVCSSGTTYDNVVIKPMLTEDLSATYDDFVPYTGEGETLTHDVAELKQDLDALTNYHTEKTLIGKFCGLNHYRNVYTGVINNSSGIIHIPHGIATSNETAYVTNFSAYGCKIFPELDGNAYIIDLKDNVWFDLSSGSNEIALKYPDSENCEFNYTIIIEYAIKE